MVCTCASLVILRACETRIHAHAHTAILGRIHEALILIHIYTEALILIHIYAEALILIHIHVLINKHTRIETHIYINKIYKHKHVTLAFVNKLLCVWNSHNNNNKT